MDKSKINTQEKTGAEEKHPVILPPPDAEDRETLPEDPDYIIPDDEDDQTPLYEAPEPGEGP